MRSFLSILVVCFFCMPSGLQAQSSPVGDWISSGKTPEGESWSFKVSIKADNTYTVDFGADGQVEIRGTYTLDGQQMTIKDNPGSECTGTGVYKFAVDGNNITMTMISDECKGRSGPEGVMKMSRA